MASIKNDSAVDQSQIKSIYKRIIPVNCSWCLSKCTEKISINRDTMEWCDASRMPTTTLPFCCYECHDEFASNHLRQYYDENLEDEYIPDHIKPKHRRCAQCCTRCTGSISLLKKRTATQLLGSELSFCEIECYTDYATSRLTKDFKEGKL